MYVCMAVVKMDTDGDDNQKTYQLWQRISYGDDNQKTYELWQHISYGDDKQKKTGDLSNGDDDDGR